MLFSTSPKSEEYLKAELWGCFKHIGIPFNILYKMPTRDRKYYISRHNNETKQYEEKYERMKNKGQRSLNGNLNSYAALDQQNARNSR